MGRSPGCSRDGLHKGLWTLREDALLTSYIQKHGEGNWKSLPKEAGLLRCGKSCRLRWMNYLRPDIKRGNITSEEEDLIIRLHSLLGNRWSLIAGRLPSRTDNEVKNYWNNHLCKKLRQQGFVFNQTASKIPKRSQAHNRCSRKIGSEETQTQTPDMKIYAPKPTRVVPMFGGCNVNGRGGEEEEEGSDGRTESCASMVSWSDEEEVENLAQTYTWEWISI